MREGIAAIEQCAMKVSFNGAPEGITFWVKKWCRCAVGAQKY